jgi:membrane-anchored protein YejM (alkaline phosphatase superfamily)
LSTLRKNIIGSHNVLFITLDTLRYDVAVQELENGRTPNLYHYLPDHQWQKRHTPGSFTYSAHHALFAGFLPIPVEPGIHQRLFAVDFNGSETIDENTMTFNAPNIVEGFRQHNYQTLCVGGVGFFNKQTPLGCTLPGLFEESYWHENYGVSCPDSFEHQIDKIELLIRPPLKRKLFLFLNVSAIHQPNGFYSAQKSDDIHSHAAALRYVDAHLERLFSLMKTTGPTLVIICSDHGTHYGDSGYVGHRQVSEAVWTVPYANFYLEP